MEGCKLSVSVDKNDHKSVPFSVMKTDTVLLKTEGRVRTADSGNNTNIFLCVDHSSGSGCTSDRVV